VNENPPPLGAPAASPNLEFARLVARVEERYAHRPAALRWKVFRLVVAGYALFLMMLGSMALLSGWLVWLALREPGGASLWLAPLGALILAALLGQSLLFFGHPFQTPQGRELTRTDCPRLFARLDELRSRSGVRPFDKVWLIGDYNAGVAHEPRWGWLGPSRRHLLIGLPLLVLLTPEQMSAVLAHEVAHDSTADDRFLVWIHRLQQRWTRVFTDWSVGRSLWLRLCGWPLQLLVARFWPEFNAHAAVLSRAEEFRADRRSAEWTSPEAAASALWCIDCFGLRLREETWPAIWRETESRPQPPDDLFDSLPRRLAAPPAADDARRWLTELETGLVAVDSTHPSLIARLEQLGVAVPDGEFPRAPARSAADEWLAPNEARLRDEFSREWQTQQARTWNILHLRTRQLQQALAATTRTEAPPLPEAPPPPDAPRVPEVSPTPAAVLPGASEAAWNALAQWIDLRGLRECELPLREFLTQYPGHPRATLTWGCLLLDRDDPAGEAFLRQIWPDGDQTLAVAAHHRLLLWLKKQGDVLRLQALQQQFLRVTEDWQAAELERREVTVANRFLPVTLSAPEQAHLRDLLSGAAGVERAWLAEKQLRHRPADRLFVLAISLRSRGFWDLGRLDRSLAVCRQLSRKLELPGQLLVISDVGRYRKVAQKLRRRANLEFPLLPGSSPES